MSTSPRDNRIHRGQVLLKGTQFTFLNRTNDFDLKHLHSGNFPVVRVLWGIEFCNFITKKPIVVCVCFSPQNKWVIYLKGKYKCLKLRRQKCVTSFSWFFSLISLTVFKKNLKVLFQPVILLQNLISINYLFQTLTTSYNYQLLPSLETAKT